MKFNVGLLAVALQITRALSVTALEVDLAADCGDLSVMTVPEGADPSTVRKCADHPLGNDRKKYEQSLPLADQEFQKRDATPAQLKGADIFGRAEQACYCEAGLGITAGRFVGLLEADSGAGPLLAVVLEIGCRVRLLAAVGPMRLAERALVALAADVVAKSFRKHLFGIGAQEAVELLCDTGSSLQGSGLLWVGVVAGAKIERVKTQCRD